MVNKAPRRFHKRRTPARELCCEWRSWAVMQPRWWRTWIRSARQHRWCYRTCPAVWGPRWAHWEGMLHEIVTLHYFTKYNMSAIEPWSRDRGDEKLDKYDFRISIRKKRSTEGYNESWMYLWPVRVWTSISHWKKSTSSVLNFEIFVWEGKEEGSIKFAIGG